MTWLNVGCGPFLAHKPWINVDRNDGEYPNAFRESMPLSGMRTPDILAPSWAIPVADGSCDRIYLGHLVEHLTLDEVALTMAELRRLAAPGCEILLVAPNVITTAEMVYGGTRQWGAFWDAHGMAGRGTPNADPYAGKPGDVHQWSCSQEALHFMALWQFSGCTVRPLAVCDIPVRWPLVSRVTDQSAVLIRCPD